MESIMHKTKFESTKLISKTNLLEPAENSIARFLPKLVRDFKNNELIFYYNIFAFVIWIFQ